MSDFWRMLAFFGLIGFLLWRNLPGALAFVRPGWIRAKIAGGPDAVSARGPAMRQMLGDLEELGFQPLGLIAEGRPLAATRHELVLAHPEARCFAGVRPVKNEAWLSFVTPFSDGATVITTDYHWPSIDEGDYLAGGLPGSSPLDVLNAHRRRVQRFVDAGHPLDDRFTLEARAEAGRAFYATGPGRRDTRRREIRGMVFSSVALIWVAMTVFEVLRNLGTN